MAYYDIPTLSLIALWELWVLREGLGIAEVVEAVGVLELWVLGIFRVLRMLWELWDCGIVDVAERAY